MSPEAKAGYSMAGAERRMKSRMNKIHSDLRVSQANRRALEITMQHDGQEVQKIMTGGHRMPIRDHTHLIKL